MLGRAALEPKTAVMQALRRFRPGRHDRQESSGIVTRGQLGGTQLEHTRAAQAAAETLEELVR